jgi:hypothetical protein
VIGHRFPSPQGTAVETPNQIASFMDQCGPYHGILLDTGDETVGGSNHSFMSAVVDGLFTVSGDGGVDFQPVIEILHAAKYEGGPSLKQMV